MIVVDPEGQVVAVNPTASNVFLSLGLGPVRRVEQLPLSPTSLDDVRGQLRGDPPLATRPDLGHVLPVALNGHQAKLLPTVMPIPEFGSLRAKRAQRRPVCGRASCMARCARVAHR